MIKLKLTSTPQIIEATAATIDLLTSVNKKKEATAAAPSVAIGYFNKKFLAWIGKCTKVRQKLNQVIIPSIKPSIILPQFDVNFISTERDKPICSKTFLSSNKVSNLCFQKFLTILAAFSAETVLDK